MSRITRTLSVFRGFLASGAAGGVILMAVAALALVIANSPLAQIYFDALHVYVGPFSVIHWVNDVLMTAFFLLVGLEIKREFAEGALASWSARILPGACAIGGMIAPALVYLIFNGSNVDARHGWAIPAATDIAFALGALALLGSRVPVSLKIFLAALAIVDDLGAVLIIALFYSGELSLVHIGVAVCVVASLIAMNVKGITQIWPYLAFGCILWWSIFSSGLHATLAGVLLALTIPIRGRTLHRLEHALHAPVSFAIVPVFGFANAGVALLGLTPSVMIEPIPLGVAAGLVIGKLIGVFGVAAILILTRVSKLPSGAGWVQLLGVSILCGVGFTMSLFIGMLAFADPLLQERVKIGVIAGSLVAGALGSLILLGVRPTRSAATFTQGR